MASPLLLCAFQRPLFYVFEGGRQRPLKEAPRLSLGFSENSPILSQTTRKDGPHGIMLGLNVVPLR
jgi:hypothetical protein